MYFFSRTQSYYISTLRLSKYCFWPLKMFQNKVNFEYVVANSDDDIYFLSANLRQSIKSDKDVYNSPNDDEQSHSLSHNFIIHMPISWTWKVQFTESPLLVFLIHTHPHGHPASQTGDNDVYNLTKGVLCASLQE